MSQWLLWCRRHLQGGRMIVGRRSAVVTTMPQFPNFALLCHCFACRCCWEVGGRSHLPIAYSALARYKLTIEWKVTYSWNDMGIFQVVQPIYLPFATHKYHLNSWHVLLHSTQVWVPFKDLVSVKNECVRCVCAFPHVALDTEGSRLACCKDTVHSVATQLKNKMWRATEISASLLINMLTIAVLESSYSSTFKDLWDLQAHRHRHRHRRKTDSHTQAYTHTHTVGYVDSIVVRRSKRTPPVPE